MPKLVRERSLVCYLLVFEPFYGVSFDGKMNKAVEISRDLLVRSACVGYKLN